MATQDLLGVHGVVETTLWTLHNRACESLRGDAFFRDPQAERIYEAIDYPFERHFGPPDSSHAARALAFDEVVGDWLAAHPGGTVVELGCGLETQCLRLDNGQLHWLAVDLPEAITLRERFISPTTRQRHWRGDACVLDWAEAVDAQAPVFIVAQGLLMYLQPEQVRSLLQGVAARFAPLEMMFDVVPPWAVLLTQSPGGMWKTVHYRVPPMHWGIGQSLLPGVLHEWLGKDCTVRWIDYPPCRGLPAWHFQWAKAWPWTRDLLPGMVHVRVQAGAGT